jgi:hypothetical protein
MRKFICILSILAGGLAAAPLAAAAAPPVLYAIGIAGGSGSAIGPGGDLFVTEGLAGQVSRIDKNTGQKTTYASGLPAAVIGIGGPIDVAFIGTTAYVLVTLVGAPFTSAIDGIYRVDDAGTFTVIADIGAWSAAHPPATPFFLPDGVQYALEPYRDGFLVTDGHHNRVLYVTLDGQISELQAFDNIVPTGMEVIGDSVLVAEAGPAPHLPAVGKVVELSSQQGSVQEVASGVRLPVDVQRGRGLSLYVLGQGVWAGNPETDAGTPAQPNTGTLGRVNPDGSVDTIASGINQPTSMQIIGDTAYVVTLTGEIWKYDDISDPPWGQRHAD